MAEQRDEAITPKTAEAEPVTVAVHTNQAVTETEQEGEPQALPSFDNQGLSTYGTISGMNGTRQQKRSFSMDKEDAMDCCATICSFIVMIVLLIISLISIVIGGVYFKDCTLSPKIPIFLIALGCCLFTYMVVAIIVYGYIVHIGGAAALEFFKYILKAINLLFYFVYLGVGVSGAFFVLGSFDEWKEYRDDVDSQFYCNSVLYLFAFVVSILLMAYSVIATCYYCYYCCKICVLDK